MSDEQPQQAAETTATDGKPAMGAESAQSKPADFEAWLSGQPDEVRKMYETHTTGLKSALDKERARNKKRDDDAAKVAQAEADKQLSEVERVKKQLDAMKTERDELAQRVKMQAARDALLVAAEKAKIVFASQLAQQDALRLALESAEIDDEGAIKDASGLLMSVVKEREYLIKPANGAGGSTNAAARGGSTAPVLDEAAKRELAARYGVRPQYI